MQYRSPAVGEWWYVGNKPERCKVLAIKNGAKVVVGTNRECRSGGFEVTKWVIDTVSLDDFVAPVAKSGEWIRAVVLIAVGVAIGLFF
jgi:hypothetical protein